MTYSGTVVDQISYFQDIAQNYEDVRGTEIWPSLLHTLSSVVPNTRTVLDVATGTGLFSVRLAQQGFRVIGVDQKPPHAGSSKIQSQASRLFLSGNPGLGRATAPV